VGGIGTNALGDDRNDVEGALDQELADFQREAEKPIDNRIHHALDYADGGCAVPRGGMRDPSKSLSAARTLSLLHDGRQTGDRAQCAAGCSGSITGGAAPGGIGASISSLRLIRVEVL